MKKRASAVCMCPLDIAVRVDDSGKLTELGCTEYALPLTDATRFWRFEL